MTDRTRSGGVVETQEQPGTDRPMTRRALREAALAAAAAAPEVVEVPSISVPVPVQHPSRPRPAGHVSPAGDRFVNPAAPAAALPVRTASGSGSTGGARIDAARRAVTTGAVAAGTAASTAAPFARAAAGLPRRPAPGAPQPYGPLARPSSARPAVPHAVSPSALDAREELARAAALSSLAALRQRGEAARTIPPVPAPPSDAPVAAAQAAAPAPTVAVPAVPAPAVPAVPAVDAPAAAAPAVSAVPAVDAPAAAAPSASAASLTSARSRRDVVASRRALEGRRAQRHDGASFRRGAEGPRASHGRRMARMGVLASLAVATIAAPIASGLGSDAEALTVAQDGGRSTLEVITAQTRAVTEAAIVADGSTLAGRDAAIASRSTEREVLPGCDTDVSVASSNGRLSGKELCALAQDGHQLQPEAAVAFTALNEAFHAKFGVDICLSDSYRTLGGQYSVARTKPGLAAQPGRSQHGLGLAVDMCSSSYRNTAQWNWLKANGPAYGWDNPAWARRGGSGAYEPWHWEYFPIVEAGKSR